MSTRKEIRVENVFQEGPYLQVACLCEKVLEEKDGVKTAVRIVDRVTRTMVGTGATEQMEPFQYHVMFLLKLKTGKNPGKHEIQIHLVNPRNEEAPPLTQILNFEEGEERGIDVVLNLVMNIQHEGVYWIDVYINQIRITRAPLRVIYVMQRHGVIESERSLQ